MKKTRHEREKIKLQKYGGGPWAAHPYQIILNLITSRDYLTLGSSLANLRVNWSRKVRSNYTRKL